MRKKFLGGKRVLALALALSMVVSEAAFAAPADVAEEAIEEVVEAESVSANEAVSEATEAAPAEEADEAEAEVTEEAAETDEAAETEEAEDVEAETAINGTPSKVIGLEGKGTYNTVTNEAGTIVATYSYARTYQNEITVPGKFEQGSETGLYFINGKYYVSVDYNDALNLTTVSPYNEAVLADTIRNSETNYLYSVNGVFYLSGGSKYYVPSSAVVPMGEVATAVGESRTHAVRRLYGQYAKSDAWYANEYGANADKFNFTPDYYKVGDKCYKPTSYDEGYDYWEYRTYFNVSEEIVLGAQRVNFTWNSVCVEEEYKLDAQGNEIWVGYEVKINDQEYQGNTPAYDTDNSCHYLVTGSGCSTDEVVAVGSSVKAQVRAVYYVLKNDVYTDADGKPAGDNNYHVVSYGPWSEPCTYKLASKTKIPAISSVTASVMNNLNHQVKLAWNTVNQANYYEVYRIDSKKDLGMTAATFGTWYDSDSSDISTSSATCYETGMVWYYDSDYPFHYYAVCPKGVCDGALYANDNNIDNIVTFAVATTAGAMEAAYTPVVTGMKVEKRANGKLVLVWDEIDAEVTVYAYDKAAFPAFYNYRELAAKRETVITIPDGEERHLEWVSWENRYKVVYGDGRVSYTNGSTYITGPATVTRESTLNADLSQQDKKVLNKVQSATVNGEEGSLDLSKFTMIPGKKYYFIAHTYDSKDYNTAKATPLSYTIMKETTENGVVTKTPEAVSYNIYNAYSAPSAVVSATRTLSKPGVDTTVTKNSVKLTMDDDDATGYEIYRKSGKKYKKIATITNDVYTDANLKTGSQYTYKVRRYYYNTDTKTKYYSDYSLVTAKTADAANIQVKVTEKSQTSVKVSWTKVAGVTKYEVYRSNMSNCDPKVISKKFNKYGNAARELKNARYELIKTITKAKTTSLTDKKLTAGETYSYIVVAYTKAGKTTEYVSDGDSVALRVKTPGNVKTKTSGSKVKVTWDPDKYAAKFEIRYTVYDKNGVPKTDKPVKASAKSNSFTVKNVGSGEWVSVSVRAYGKDKTYSEWTTAYDSGKSLGVVKGVKATPIIAKLASGTQVDAVKISWKKVSGAKYYRVYRSTTEASYNADDKVYASGHGVDISKEANDNFQYYANVNSTDVGGKTNYSNAYDMYLGVYGSITGTSAVDYSTDLKKGVDYYYTVVAYGDVPSTYAGSYVSSIGTIKAVKVTFGADVALTLKNAKAGKVTVSYKKVPGAKKYLIMRADKKNGTFKQIGSTKKTSFTDTKAKKGKTYYYKVVATGTNALKADMNAESPVKSIKVKK